MGESQGDKRQITFPVGEIKNFSKFQRILFKGMIPNFHFFLFFIKL